MSVESDPSFLSYANTALLTVITVGGGMMYRRLGILNEQLSVMNNRVGKLEQWRDGHDGWARETIERNDREHGEIHQRIETTRQSVHDLRNEAFKLRIRDWPKGGD